MASKIIDPNTGKGFIGSYFIPPADTFVSKWNANSKTYLSRFDEALQQSWTNAMAMRRDCYIDELLRARQYPTSEMNWHLVPDDPEDELQKFVVTETTKIIDAIPHFQNLKLNLLEAIFFGRYGTQLTWDYIQIDGEKRLGIVDHAPVQGDKIIFKWDGTPGVLVYRGWRDPAVKLEEYTDRGMALFLSDPYFRDRFILHRHQKMDMDFLYESNQAGATQGLGLRHFSYWTWNLRMEILSFIVDGLQRISANGMLIGRYEAGNIEARNDMSDALKNLIQFNVGVFPRYRDVSPDQDAIERIEPSNIAYDVMLDLLKYLDEILEKEFLGQTLSSGTGTTGLGSNVAKLHTKTLQRLVDHDARNLGETLDTDLVQKIIKYNWGKLPFKVRFEFEIEDESSIDTKEKLEAMKLAHEMGLDLSKEKLYEIIGSAAPKTAEDTLGAEDLQAQQTNNIQMKKAI